MNKTLKKIVIILIVLAAIGLAIGGYFIYRHSVSYIGADRALEAALRDAGVSASEIIDRDVEFEKTRNAKWYDVDFETFSTEYSYTVDAKTGEILNAASEPND